MSTPTPLTDEAWSSAFNAEDFSASSVALSMRVFSQKIEIELAAANEACRVASEDALLMRDDLYKQLAAATTERDHWQKIAVSASREREHNANVAQAMTAERDQLRAENATLRPQMSTPMPRTCGEISCDECNDRYAALAAECDQLRDDLAKERARLDSGQILLTISGERVWHCGVDLRAAIDAAMKEDAK